MIDLSTPRIMAIINLSPDSFYHSISSSDQATTLKYIENCMHEGAEIIDLGGMSTRPGSLEIHIEEEWRRLYPTLKAARSAFPEIIISIDTYRSEIVQRAYEEGIDLVNDISGGAFDPMMFETVGQLNLPYVLMHNRSKPLEMQQMTNYDDLMSEVYDYFVGKIHLLESKGVKDIIIDPGFGFAKTIHQNYYLLKYLDSFNSLAYPLLVGISRKSMLYKFLDTTADDVLAVNTAMHFKALEHGASILRVHDVKEAQQCIRLFSEWKKL